MFDLKITGGTVVDGTGADRYRADIGVKDGRIVDVRRRNGDDAGLEGDAAETLDATGRIVAPGFVDIHTHYDGQVSWDPLLEPSSLHGVTTVVGGNCGVGFAPVTPGREQWLIELMEGVEDIPGSALAEGITWQWESFPEYLDAIEKRDLAVDFGTHIAHRRPSRHRRRGCARNVCRRAGALRTGPCDGGRWPRGFRGGSRGRGRG